MWWNTTTVEIVQVRKLDLTNSGLVTKNYKIILKLHPIHVDWTRLIEFKFIAT